MPKYTPLTAILVVTLGACANSGPPNPNEIIPSSLVVHSVKCGLALALYKEQNPPAGTRSIKRLTGNLATVEIGLKKAVTQSAGGGITASPGVIAWQGGSLGFGFAASRQSDWTVTSVLNFSYKLDATNTDVCSDAKIDMSNPDGDPFGFSQWLNSTLADLSTISLKKPTGTLDQMSFEAAFGVTRDKSANGSLQLAFITGDVKLAETRNDLQRLKIVISPSPPSQAGHGGSAGPGLGTSTTPGHPSLGPATPKFPNFSSSASTD